VLPLALLAVAVVLIVTGVALLSVPAALIAAGALIGGVSLFVDFDKVKGGDA
jgi:hypothetical protein